MRKFAVSNVMLLVVAFLLTAAMASPAQTLTVLHSFSGPEGAAPTAPLVLGHDGNYYGTTSSGGSTSSGNVFKMTPSGTVTDLHDFCQQSNCTDGYGPQAGLVLGSDGNFYGTTSYGGTYDSGLVFKITPSGTFTNLHNFCQQGGCPDGLSPTAPLVLASDGNFYGTTSGGGTQFLGIVFRISPGGSFTKLYSFDQAHGQFPNGLIQGSDGKLYGTTNNGGADGVGTVFKITLSGSITLLHTFCSQSGCGDGGQPYASLLQAPDGNFYGTTFTGGANDYGTIYKITSGGTLTTVYSFVGLDGIQPKAPLILGGDGNFYGTTSAGGTGGDGTVVVMTPAGALTNLCNFTGASDGAFPMAPLVKAANGGFIGTTTQGGSHGDGVVFQLTIQQVSTTTVLTSAPNPSYQGENVTLTATVTAQNGSTPSGTVVFNSNGAQIGTATLDNSGVAVLNYSGLAVGNDSLTAVYQGSFLLQGSTSNTVTQVVHPGSTTTVTSAPNPSTVGQQVTITATVGPSGPPQPTGTISFTSNSSTISGCTNLTLSNRTAVCMTTGLLTGTDVVLATYSGDSNYGPSQGSVVQIVNPVPMALEFVAVSPCRIVDTRHTNGTFGGPAISGGSSRTFPLTEGDNPCGIPASAVAYSINVTVVPQGTLGYLTIWPTGEGQPAVSTLNSLDGRIKANAAIVPAGTPNGSVSVYVTNTTNVVLDINGYFRAANGSTLAFYPLAPCRVADTRNSNGPLGGPSLAAGVERDFPVLDSACGLPGEAVAYSFNFTVVPKTSAGVGYLTVWPYGQSQPGVSTLNDLTNTIVANAGLVPAGTDGQIAAYATNDTDLIIDANGYFAAPGTGGLSFYPLTPCRVIDTRHNNGQPFTGELTVPVQTSPCGPPATAEGYVFNATVVPQGSLGYLTLWPDPLQRPTASTLNALDGAITSNMAIVPNGDGKTDAYASGYTQLILDISGYFAP